MNDDELETLGLLNEMETDGIVLTLKVIIYKKNKNEC